MDTHLILASAAEAFAIGSMAEGRLEALVDDGLEDSPDAEDLRAVIDWIWSRMDDVAYPARLPLELGSAQAEQLRITIENVVDQGADWDADNDDEDAVRFTAHIERAK